MDAKLIRPSLPLSSQSSEGDNYTSDDNLQHVRDVQKQLRTGEPNCRGQGKLSREERMQIES